MNLVVIFEGKEQRTVVMDDLSPDVLSLCSFNSLKGFINDDVASHDVNVFEILRVNKEFQVKRQQKIPETARFFVIKTRETTTMMMVMMMVMMMMIMTRKTRIL